MRKFLIALSTIALLTPAITNISSFAKITVYESKLNGYENFLELDDDFFKNDIATKAVKIADKPYMVYDNKKFYSDLELQEYFLKNEMIKSVKTSSNPAKIIDNTEINSLKADQIYGNDLADFQRVYRNYSGNVIYVLKDAFNSYANLGGVKEQFKYDYVNEINNTWFNTVEEAKFDLKNHLEINKGLYYHIGNKWYNALNPEDSNALMTTFTDGYQFRIDKTMFGAKLEKPLKPIKGFGNKFFNDVKESVYPLFSQDKYGRDVYETRLKLDWWNRPIWDWYETFKSGTESFFDSIVKVGKTYIIHLKSDSSYNIKIIGKKNVKSFDGQEVYLRFNDDDYNFSSDTKLEERITHENYWLTGSDWFYDWKLKNKKYYWNDFVEVAWSNNLTELKQFPQYGSFRMELSNTGGIKFPWGGVDFPNIQNDFHPKSFQSGNLKLYALPINKDISDKDYNEEIFYEDPIDKAGLYNPQDITVEEKARLYNAWFENFYNKTLTNFNLDNDLEPTTLTFEMLKNGEKISANHIGNKNRNWIPGEMYKDKFYSFSNNLIEPYSISDTYEQWLEEKPKRLEMKKVEVDGKIVEKPMYKILNDFYIDEKEIENYFPLAGKASDLEPIVRYYYSTDNHYSNLNGDYLYATEAIAKEQRSLILEATLNKRYVATDAAGNVVVSENSKEEALNSLWSKINLSSKFIHKDEIKSWSQKDNHSFDSIVSDGRYIVYQVLNPLNKEFIYFSTLESAYKFLKEKAISMGNIINQNSDEEFYYEYNFDNGFIFKTVFYNKDFDLVLEQLNQYREHNNLKKKN